MNKQVLFIQGGGEGGYEVDKRLVASLQKHLGKGYIIHYPELQVDESAPDFGWLQQIQQNVSQAENDVIIVAHSLGASMLLKYLSENAVDKKIKGVFLLATPFWNGNEDWQTGLKLREDFAEKLPEEIPVFFYHCQDDEEVPFSNFDHYKQKITHATFHEIKQGGHLFNNVLTLVAKDIKSLR